MNRIFQHLAIWLLTGTIGSIILSIFLTAFPDGPETAGEDLFGIFAIVSLLFSIPGFLIYHQISRLTAFNIPEYARRNLFRSVAALLLTGGSVFILWILISGDDLFRRDGEALIRLLWLVVFSYSTPFIAFIWLFDRNAPAAEERNLPQPDHPAVKPQSIIYAIAVIHGLRYLELLYHIITSFRALLQPALLIMPLIALVLIPTGIFLLLKDRRAGWCILFIFAFLPFITIWQTVYFYIRYHIALNAGSLFSILGLLVSITLVYLHCRPALRRYMGITRHYLAGTITISVIAGLILMASYALM